MLLIVSCCPKPCRTTFFCASQPPPTNARNNFQVSGREARNLEMGLREQQKRDSLGTQNLSRDTFSNPKTVSEASRAPETLRKSLFGGRRAARELQEASNSPKESPNSLFRASRGGNLECDKKRRLTERFRECFRDSSGKLPERGTRFGAPWG